MALLHRHTGTPNDRPDASSQLSAGNPTHRVFMRTSLKVTGPLLVVGACTAVAMATGPSSSSTDLPSQAKTTVPTTSSQNTVGSSQSIEVQSSTPQTGPATGSATHSYSVTNQGSSSAQVTVNGQQVTVPPNGTVQQSYTSPDGNSSLSVSASTTGSGAVGSSSSFSANVNVSTDSTTNSGSSTTFTDGESMQ